MHPGCVALNENPNGGMFFRWVFHGFAGFVVFSMVNIKTTTLRVQRLADNSVIELGKGCLASAEMNRHPVSSKVIRACWQMANVS